MHYSSLLILGFFTSPLVARIVRKNLIAKCYRPFGCFDIGGAFLSIRRPINLFPLHPNVLRVEFGLRTRRNPVYYQELVAGHRHSFLRSNFDPSLPTKLIVHGFLERNSRKWILEMSTELLKSRNMNVIGVDWEIGAKPPYSLAVANSRLVGSIIAHFIKYIAREFGTPPRRFHIIGHSLGAHAAGYAGQNIHGLGRISGLDPAQPYFTKTHPEVRLDPGDALFVDVLHTDAHPIPLQSLGSSQPSGHVDFYPNGGYTQPGCDTKRGLIEVAKNKATVREGIRHFIGCNHIRAYEYFTESINSKCPFTSFACSSWDKFQVGRCSECGKDGSGCARLGYHSDKWTGRRYGATNVKFYLTTADRKPYCTLQRKVTIKLLNYGQRRTENSLDGKFSVRLSGTRRRTGNINLKHRYKDVNRRTEVTFMTGTYLLGHLRTLKLRWKHTVDLLHPTSWFEKPSIYVRRAIVDDLETGRRNGFCSSKRRGFKSGTSISLERCSVYKQTKFIVN